MPQKKNNSKQTKVSAERNGDKSQNAYFLSLELENVRCFGERQKIDFSDGHRNWKRWTIILGNNGTGKTTLLQSLVVMLPLLEKLNKKQFYLPMISELIHSIVRDPRRNDRQTCELKVKFLPLDKSSPCPEMEWFHSNSHNYCLGWEVSFSINCFAYGSSRKAGATSLSEQDKENAYKNLFDETVLLINPEEWLLQADYASKRKSEFQKKREQELKFIKEILIKILPDVEDLRFSETESGRTPKPIVEFRTHYGWVESRDLSLGYRTSMAWMVDFASRMFDLYPESENPLAEPAVVLIDEIDLHLHPKWQRELIDYLTNLFPNTQFIVTTHSPLIVQAAAARDANIVVCRREGDHVVIDQSVEAVKNWRTDQILTSDFFDLPTARPKEIEPFLEERQKILSKAKLTKKDEMRLTELENEIGFMPVSENLEDDKAMDIIRRAAERLQSETK